MQNISLVQVRAELKALFTADCIRRIATEVLLPWLLQSLSAASKATQARTRLHALHVHKPYLSRVAMVCALL